jgi:hypothetical protein
MTALLINLNSVKGTSKVPDWAKAILNSKFITYISLSVPADSPVRSNNASRHQKHNPKFVILI